MIGCLFKRRQETITTNKGFTLIELLVVIAIVVLVMSLGLPAIQRITYQSLSSTVRKFVGTVRSIRSDAILLNRIFRLCIDMDRNQWWVEEQKEFSVLGATEMQAGALSGTGNATNTPSNDANFVLATKYGKDARSLPNRVIFMGVVTERQGMATVGVSYIHFFPNGFNEPAIIQFAESRKQLSYSFIQIEP